MDHPECDGHVAKNQERGERRQQAEHPAEAAAELGQGREGLEDAGYRGIRPHPRGRVLDLGPTVQYHRRPRDEAEDQDPHGTRPAEECREQPRNSGHG